MKKLKPHKRCLALLVTIVFIACGSSDDPTGDSIDDAGTSEKDAGKGPSGAQDSGMFDAGVTSQTCKSASIEIGYEICVHRVSDTETWEVITVPGIDVGGRVVTKYLAPANKDAPLSALFIVAAAFSKHFDFLYQGFPDLFENLTPLDYLDLILDGETRVFFAGNLTEYTTADGPLFGFTIWDDQSNKNGTVTHEQVKKVYDDLSARFEIGSLYFVPEGANQHEAAQDWGEDFPVYEF